MSSLSLLSSPPVLAQLQHARLISREECKGLSDTSGVITVQSGKSDAVLRESATVLMELGFKEESAFLSGEQIKPHPVKYAMHWNGM